MSKVAEKLDGVWEMVDMSTKFPEKPAETHKGASGQLIYDAKLKTVFAHIVRPDDKSPTGELRFKYAGKFELSAENDNEITHQIEWATNPKIVGKAMKREFNLSADGQNLTITGESTEYPEAKIDINWKKIPIKQVPRSPYSYSLD